MKRFGGWLVLTIAIVFALGGTFLAIDAILRLLSVVGGSHASAYELGGLAGQIVGLLLLFAIAWKLFMKGRAILNARNARATANDSI
jgi:hypothetical protein